MKKFEVIIKHHWNFLSPLEGLKDHKVEKWKQIKYQVLTLLDAYEVDLVYGYPGEQSCQFTTKIIKFQDQFTRMY
jgi:hypothetical protein